MNGSRSNTPTHGAKPSLDQLNRTIEGLEARIQGLMGDRQRPLAQPASYSQPAAYSQPNGQVDAILERQRTLGSARERVSSAMERPRSEAHRSEPYRAEQHRQDNYRQENYRQDMSYDAPRMSEPAQSWDRPAPRNAAPDPALAEIAATLGALRQELRQGITDDMRDSFGEIRSEMRSIKTIAATAPQEGMESLRTDLAYLGASIERLEKSRTAPDTDRLRADFDELRGILGQVARDDSVRKLEARLAGAERAVTDFDPKALREELVQLAWRIDGIKSGLGEMSSGPVVRALEEKLLAVASAVEALGRNMQSQGDLTQHFTGLDSRLDEISRAIAASTRQAGSVYDSATLQRLESRIDELVEHIAAMSQADPAAELNARLEQLAEKIEDMSNEDAARNLEARIAQLSGMIERNFRETAAPTDYTDHLADISRKIDGLGGASASDLLERLELLSRKMDGFEIPAPAPVVAEVNPAAMSRLEDRLADIASRLDEAAAAPAPVAPVAEINPASMSRLETRLADLASRLDEAAAAPAPAAPIAEINPAAMSRLETRLADLTTRLDEAAAIPASVAAIAEVDTVAMSRLESRLADIAARLDESASAPVADMSALQNLEDQIARLSGLLNQSASNATVAQPDGLGSRLTAIEDYIATSDEFIVEAARQAAETVVEAYSRNGFAAQGPSASEITALAGLAEDLRALENHTRSSEERTQATFEALHETLVQIAGRLNDLGNPTPAAAKAVERVVAAETVREAAIGNTMERLRESVAMPKATQPEFARVDHAAADYARPEFTPVEVLAGDPPPRRAPENSKVEVLDEAELMPALGTDVTDITAEDAPMAPATSPKASRSLIANLAQRFKPGKKDKAAKPVATDEASRLAVNPAPALDPGEAVVDAEPNLLLEPGAGVPDVKKILERVRNGQSSGRSDTSGSGTSDVIAAARRAAQAAAAEAGAQKLAQPTAFKKEKDRKAKAPSAKGQSEVRRPILLAAAAVLLVIISYPLVSGLIGGGASDPAPQAVQESTVETPVNAITAPVDSDADNQVPATDTTGEDTAVPTPADETGNDAGDDQSQATTNSVADTDSAVADLTPQDDATDTAAQDTSAKAPDIAVDATKDVVAPVDELKTDVAPADQTVDQATEQKADQTAAIAETPAGDITPPAGLQPASLAEAVKKGDALALFEVGARYTDGRGVNIDLAEAAKWYALSAERGNAPAEYRLANFYEKGTGVTRDIDKAKTLYRSAADKGNASAMHNLAVLYATGVGGTPDFAEAARWFTMAADHNVRDSQFNLAILYARGNGVQQNLEETYKWFAIAAREGDQDAAQKRDEVAKALSPEQLKSAKAKADLWKPQAMIDDANTPMVPDEWVAKGQTTATIDMKRAIRNIQAILNMNGFNAGKPDGEMGKQTVGAIRAFQKSIGQKETGQIDDALVRELLKRNKS